MIIINPTISIIVPIYNAEAYIHRCIDSILAQTFTDFELILVDDGSRDNSSAICDGFAVKDSRVQVIHKDNGGVSSARNKGLEAARGKYILFCDSDDYVSKQWCEQLLEHIKLYPNAWVFSDIVRIKASEPHIDFEQIENALCSAQEVDYYRSFELGLSGYCWNKIYLSEIIKQHNIYFDISRTIAEDVDFNLKYLHYCDRCVYIPAKLYCYVQVEDSATQRYDPDWFAKHLPAFWERLPYIQEENMGEYCDIWLFQFLSFFPIVFDKRNPSSIFKKLHYNQRMLCSKEVQFCIKHATGKKENPIILRLLKTKNYYLYWLFKKTVNILHILKGGTAQ